MPGSENGNGDIGRAAEWQDGSLFVRAISSMPSKRPSAALHELWRLRRPSSLLGPAERAGGARERVEMAGEKMARRFQSRVDTLSPDRAPSGEVMSGSAELGR